MVVNVAEVEEAPMLLWGWERMYDTTILYIFTLCSGKTFSHPILGDVQFLQC
jgi:hypothetical protein